jgi:signal transduction histidine kinase/CheY-like chemotaxis protein
MSTTLHTLALRSEHDVVQARQRAREIAGLLGFDHQEQIRLATAVSEIARNAFRYARAANVQFHLSLERPQSFEVTISDAGYGIKNLDEVMEGRYRSQTGMGLGLIGSRRLMDTFNVQTGDSGTTVRIGKSLPSHAPFLTSERVRSIITALVRSPKSPYDEIERQNQELLATLQELRARQEEIALVNRELEDTNRGVVALYAELDERADYLRRASELKTNFLSSISHEFRTPLNSIISLARILLDRMDGDLTEEQEKQVSYIAEAARSLSDLVNDLLDLAKVEAGKVKIRIKTFEVAELFSALKGMLKPLLADNTSVDLIFEDAARLSSLHSDEGKISQILRNFISNAIKFTPRGEIRVKAELAENDSVVFRVQDTGIGIAQEHQETIFQEFAQIENPLQWQYRGTGLGLPLCRNLAILLGGRVWVESELGRGSTFYAEIPVVYRGEADVVEIPATLPAPEFSRPPVLLMDARSDTFSKLEMHFRKSEFQLIHADNPARARHWLDRHLPEAVISDMEAQWSPIWESLPAKVPWIAIISSDENLPSIPLEAGAVCKKPLDPTSLLHELRRLTGRAEPRRLLLVDDNDLSLYILRELLDRSWLQLLEARNGQDALEIIRRERLDGVILDLLMPGMSGFEVLEQVRSMEATRQLPVIIYTSKTLSSEEKQGFEKLGAPVLSKADVAQMLAPDLLLNSLAQVGIFPAKAG